MNKKEIKNRLLRGRRVLAKIQPKSDRFRLSVFRSNRFIYAQIIDDNQGFTLASATNQRGGKKKTPKEVGYELAEKAIEKKIKKIYFDRGRFAYLGQLKELAEGAREKGLEF